jgi:hypothetical protein
MFARFLLILTVAIGLLAGPAWTRENCLADVKIKACECCPMPGESCCIRESEAPSRSAPAQSLASGPDLRDLVAPILVVLGVPPEVGAVGYGEARTVLTATDSVAVIDRICVRLI